MSSRYSAIDEARREETMCCISFPTVMKSPTEKPKDILDVLSADRKLTTVGIEVSAYSLAKVVFILSLAFMQPCEPWFTARLNLDYCDAGPNWVSLLTGAQIYVSAAALLRCRS